jgi:hypothetical protein
MLTYLSITKKIGKQAKTLPALLDMHAALKAQDIGCAEITIQFRSGGKLALLGIKNNATKSLKTVAHLNPFLQPHYFQVSRTLNDLNPSPGMFASPATRLAEKEEKKPTQTFAEAMACKDKDLYIQPSIQWTIPGNAALTETTLRAVDGVRAQYSPKDYKYWLVVDFNGLNFGVGTLVEAPKEYPDIHASLLGGTMGGRHSTCRFVAHEQGVSITSRCLLAEARDAASTFVPDAFTAFVKSLHDLKPKDICRTQLASTEEVKHKQGQSREEFARRVGISSEQAQKLSVNHYQMLTMPQRLLLERELFEYMTGKPPPEPESPDPAVQLRQLTTLYQALQSCVQAQSSRQNIPLWRQANAQRPMSLDAQIDWEQKMYQLLTALPYDAPVPEDTPGKECYLSDLRKAIDTLPPPKVDSFTDINALRLTAAEVMLQNRFTSFDALQSDPARDKLQGYIDQLRRDMEAAQEKAAKHMQALAEEGGLPHRLERYYFTTDGLHGGDDFVAYQHIWVPQGQPVPPSLLALGYQRDETDRALAELEAEWQAIARQIKSAASPETRWADMKTIRIDGIECRVLPKTREKFNRDKILKAAFKPLCYEKAKQMAGSVGNYDFVKQLSPQESVRVSFDFGTWRQTIDCWFVYRGVPIPGIRGHAFKLVLNGWSHRSALDITSEELFTKAIENIAFMTDVLEKEHVPHVRAMLLKNGVAG